MPHSSHSALATSYIDLAARTHSLGTVETHPGLANAFRKLGRTLQAFSEMQKAQVVELVSTLFCLYTVHAATESTVIGDVLGYQQRNMRCVKEALENRREALQDLEEASRDTEARLRYMERLKASIAIVPERVDDALEDLQDVSIWWGLGGMWVYRGGIYDILEKLYSSMLWCLASSHMYSIHRTLPIRPSNPFTPGQSPRASGGAPVPQDDDPPSHGPRDVRTRHGDGSSSGATRVRARAGSRRAGPAARVGAPAPGLQCHHKEADEHSRRRGCGFGCAREWHCGGGEDEGRAQGLAVCEEFGEGLV
ncbi:hypothetical protein BC938DRAFT_480806 [Jimgerdemannia flammicorona]|uniref:Uncharacterized protein n=1 Tax=Jimgerdemannia flammicorona TaxID=994334 RepID=A0A433QHN9_9FUNG|nr:hypothetical protein BC938DRAFT_480806 [Jimgerdemannia flammicorona]